MHSPAISPAVAAGGCWRSTATAVVAGTVVFLWHLRIATKPSPQPSSQAPPRSPCYDGVFRAAPAAAQASSSQNAISAAAAACPAAPALQRCGHRGWNACSHSSDGTLQDARDKSTRKLTDNVEGGSEHLPQQQQSLANTGNALQYACSQCAQASPAASSTGVVQAGVYQRFLADGHVSAEAHRHRPPAGTGLDGSQTA